MLKKLENFVGNVLDTSVFLGSVRLIKRAEGKSRLYGNQVRLLTPEEIQILQQKNNYAKDWNQILVTPSFKTDFIVGNTFVDQCVLGVFDGSERQVDVSTKLPSGIFHSTLINTEIGDDSLVYGVGTVSNYILQGNALVYQSDALIASEGCTFGNGIEISVGIETGGREVLSYAELNIPVAEAVAKERSDKPFLEAYEKFVKAYVEVCGLPFGVVESYSVVRNTRKVVDTYVGGSVVIDGATLVENCTLFSAPEECTSISHGAYVRNTCVQWGCEITSMAIVEDSVLTEHSHVERHGKVTQSIIGPNSGVAEGEVTASLLGPFVGFRHQALLISAIWSEGKGNVGYGANIGSNHTSKAPDQEIWCGEGTFFGLGVNIKFPTDFTEAPYSIIATGVDTLPQRMEFPFSLINKPSFSSLDVSPAYNEIFPGWVLSDNIYMVKRSEGKYKKRNKAKRTEFVFDVFRSDIVDKMVRARNRLRHIPEPKDIYSDKDVPGLGKNFMMEKSRLKGIEAYNFYIEFYALKGLMQRVSEYIQKDETEKCSAIYDDQTTDENWEHKRHIILDEGFHRRNIQDNLERLVSLQKQIAEDTQKAKEKDDHRVQKIIVGHKDAYTVASDDGFVKDVWEETSQFEKDVRDIVSRLLTM